MHYNFLLFEGLQGTHMNALNPFNSKLMTLTPKWRFVNLFSDFSPLCGAAAAAFYSAKTIILHALTRAVASKEVQI